MNSDNRFLDSETDICFIYMHGYKIDIYNNCVYDILNKPPKSVLKKKVLKKLSKNTPKLH